MRKLLLSFLTLLLTAGASAQSVSLSLDSCLQLALSSNHQLAIAQMKRDVATLNRKEAFTHYLPRVEAMGAYMRSEKELSLLSDEQKETLSGMGTIVGSQLTPVIQQAAIQNPQMAPLFQQLGSIAASMLPALNEAGAGLVDALRTDSRNTTAAALMLTQPLYMGGKIVAYNRITRYAEQIAQTQADQQKQELVLQVETAYWQIVSLESKRKLAVSYKQLIDTLDYNVQQLIAEGMASKADGLSVKVKQNEADVTLIQIDNGLALSRMLLCQLCGLDVSTEIHPTDDILQHAATSQPAVQAVDLALQQRPELHSLDLLARIQNEKVKVVRSEYLPKVALSANYLWSNPSLFNGFERKMKGMWSIGLMVNVPLVNWGEGCYKVRSARLQARIAETTLAETREKIELQATQCAQKVTEAAHREETAQRALAEADENLRFATVGMQEGVIPISNVLMAQTAWLSAQSTLLSARIDRRLAEVSLRRATGSL